MHHNTYTQHRPRLPLGLLAGVLVLALVPIIGCMAWLWLQWAALTSSAPWFVAFVRYSIVLLPIVLGSWAIGTGVTVLWRRYGWRESIAAHYAIDMKRAEVQVAPMATNFHYELNSDVESVPQLALPEPINVIKPMAEWMAWIDEQPHTLLIPCLVARPRPAKPG
jgi:hypothetical protein